MVKLLVIIVVGDRRATKTTTHQYIDRKISISSANIW